MAIFSASRRVTAAVGFPVLGMLADANADGAESAGSPLKVVWNSQSANQRLARMRREAVRVFVGSRFINFFNFCGVLWISLRVP